MNPVLCYKLAVEFGAVIYLGGIYILSRKIGLARFWAALLVFLLALSGSVLTFLHQEHLLATLSCIPFMWLCLYYSKRNNLAIYLFFTLLGLSFNFHYPQLIILYWVTILGAMGAAGLIRPRELFLALRQRKQSIAKVSICAMIGLLISASPLLYSYTAYFNQLESPFRHHKGSLESTSYEQYELINSAYSKADPRNFALFFDFKHSDRWNISLLDDNLFYIGPGFILLILLFFLGKLPNWRFHLFALFGFALLSVGTYTPLPRLLMYFIPGLQLFRQWYFFIAFFGIHALFALVSTLSTNWQAVGMRAKIFSTPWLKRCLVFGLTGLSLEGANWVMKDYQNNLTQIQSTHLSEVTQRAHFRVDLDELSRIYDQFVALPAALTPAERLRISQTGLFLWNGNKVGKELSLDGSGIRLQVPAAANTLDFQQFNDGLWQVSVDGALRNLSQSKGVKIERLTAGQEIFIRRLASPWHWLMIIMWLPLLGGLGLQTLRKIKNCFQGTEKRLATT